MKRADDFEKRRAHLADLSDEQLQNRFWEMAEKLVDPLLELGKKITTPSIERSVLLRMGFSSLEAKSIVDKTMDRGLMGNGAGNIVYRISKQKDISVRDAGLALSEGKYWDDALQIFKGGAK